MAGIAECSMSTGKLHMVRILQNFYTGAQGHNTTRKSMPSQ